MKSRINYCADAESATGHLPGTCSCFATKPYQRLWKAFECTAITGYKYKSSKAIPDANAATAGVGAYDIFTDLQMEQKRSLTVTWGISRSASFST